MSALAYDVVKLDGAQASDNDIHTSLGVRKNIIKFRVVILSQII